MLDIGPIARHTSIMQPLIIIPLVALCIALLKIRQQAAEAVDMEYWHDYWCNNSKEWREACGKWRTEFDEATDRANSISLDNVFLKAELKRKHRRVPKL